jgi:hypothetical protein
MTPLRLTWTFHALERLDERGIERETVERSVRKLHPRRRPSHGRADWRIETDGFSVLYDHPTERDMNTIRIITVWPRRRKRKRHLRPVSPTKPELS